ncbi:hypothetical protein Micbo1qcDRAFT_162128 [Microdochium bolleyi]|uniref:Uncharacterized protein n=1 Tax=Microdochium bolleyi TaxID=196109 RepID=A0A136J4B0_9PEZI|nr:hypothetical protein Micbo1qcDRAFT_162128 [Microdochium bolleyi]
MRLRRTLPYPAKLDNHHSFQNGDAPVSRTRALRTWPLVPVGSHAGHCMKASSGVQTIQRASDTGRQVFMSKLR